MSTHAMPPGRRLRRRLDSEARRRGQRVPRCDDLGIGVGEREGNEPYGLEWTKPVARFEEAVATWFGGYACGAAFFAALATRRA
jgi:hypothetical protein